MPAGVAAQRARVEPEQGLRALVWRRTGQEIQGLLEAALAFLGDSDPVLPTWGKVICDAYVSRALLNGQYYWILEPAVLLLLLGFAFVMVGASLERILNPRLQENL